jgi:hypothetical protein
VFVTDKTFQRGLIFAGKAGAFPSGVPGLGLKNKTRLVRPSRSKRSSLFDIFVSLEEKRFYSIGHCTILSSDFGEGMHNSYITLHFKGRTMWLMKKQVA